MRIVPLSELCAFRHGGTPSKAVPEFWSGKIPWVSPKDMKTSTVHDASDHITEAAVANSATSVVLPGSTLLVVRSGILAHSFPVALVTGPVAFNQDIKAVVPKSADVSAEYVYWFLRSKASDVVARGVKKGATVHSVQSGFIEGLQVPLLERDAQQRIVDLLSHAEGIVRLRRQAQQKAAELIPAIFVDMFGDPATNPKGWPERPVEDLCTVGTGATPRREVRSYYEGGVVPWVKTGEVSVGEIRQAEEHITELAVSETNCKVFPTDTILIAMYGQGQTRGRAGMLKIPAATNQACAAILPSEKVNQTFLFEMLRMQYERLRAMGRGGNQANLNLGMIKTLGVPVPPLDAQRAFARHAEALQSIQSQQALALKKAVATFDALLARAFSANRAADAVHEAEGAVA